MQNLIIRKTTISSKGQTVVPAMVRKALKLGKGDEIIWNIDLDKDKPEIVIQPKNKKWGNYLSGLGKDVWLEKGSKASEG